MLPALLAVLSLAGAPQTTTVECNPWLPQSVELGLTVSDQAQMVNGQVVMGTLDHIVLGQLACGALLYGSMNASERNATQRISREYHMNIDFDRLVGVGLQVALHEAEHVALNSADECLVEKETRAKVNGLIALLGDSDRTAAEEASATASDAALPAQYHGC